MEKESVWELCRGGAAGRGRNSDHVNDEKMADKATNRFSM